MMSTLPKPHGKTHSRRTVRGFTLSELMAVVVIVGILATIAAVGYRKYINSARSSEAVWMVNGIRAAQEAYRAETLTYLNVSGTLTNYYPTTTPGTFKTQWGGDGNNVEKWRILNVQADGAVMYGYAVVAGVPGEVEVTGLEFTADFPDAVEPWYVVQAKGDVDGDGTPSYYAATSFSNEVYWQNEGE
jgi:type IV pilus assembly protein PilA